MEKISQIIIDSFDGGLSEDKRVKIANKFSLTKHFDALTYRHKLVPYHKTEAVETKTFKIIKFLWAPRTYSGDIPASFVHFGFGIDPNAGTNRPGVYYLDTSWQTPSNNVSTVNSRNNEVFFYYKKFIYMWAGTGTLVRFDVTSAAAFDNAFKSITFTNVAQPVHHPTDDIAYFFSDNKVHKLNGTIWNDGAADVTVGVLALPTELKIVAACAYGNYLAIACTDLNNTESIVYLWDRDSSLTTLTERKYFGRGAIVHLASLNNKLTAVMNFYADSADGQNRGKILIKQPSGVFTITVNELIVDTQAVLSLTLPRVRTQVDNKLYFAAQPQLNGDTRLGIWVVDENGRLTLDTIEEEATSYEGIYLSGNKWWIAHSADGSVNRSDDNYAYSTTLTSVYDSLIFDIGDRHALKKLLGVSVSTEPLPTAGQVVLKYRKDADLDGSWTTIYTNTTDDSIQHGAINIESSGANLPEFKEIQFRIESTGGAVITGLKIKVEVINDDIIQIR